MCKKKLNKHEPKALIKTLITIVLVLLCITAANWQFHRGQARHKFNSLIEANLAKTALKQLPNDVLKNEWRPITLTGSFISGKDLLQRNSYRDGKYGFEYLTKFKTSDRVIWVDRGWVQAGANASIKPELPATPTDQVTIEGRIRSGSSLVQGRYFALPTKVSITKFRVDLLKLNGDVIPNPAELPELSDGPHYAYALQWIFFAGLIIYGRFLIRRQGKIS